MIQHVAPAPVAICGNGILEGDEVCDYGVLNNDENKYRCGPTVGTSSFYFNDDGVGSPFSTKATACIMQCASILDTPDVFGFQPYYHWADARACLPEGCFTPGEDGDKTCTPE